MRALYNGCLHAHSSIRKHMQCTYMCALYTGCLHIDLYIKKMKWIRTCVAHMRVAYMYVYVYTQIRVHDTYMMCIYAQTSIHELTVCVIDGCRNVELLVWDILGSDRREQRCRHLASELCVCVYVYVYVYVCAYACSNRMLYTCTQWQEGAEMQASCIGALCMCMFICVYTCI